MVVFFGGPLLLGLLGLRGLLGLLFLGHRCGCFGGRFGGGCCPFSGHCSGLCSYRWC